MNKNLNIKVNLQGAQKATTQMKGLGDRVKGTVSSMTSMATLVRGAFATSLIYGTVNLLKTAGAAEGVERAFRRLNKPDLLNNLKSATRGMVSDFDLMKAAVRANNFQIPLEQMGTLLEFAQRRAQETGESVDYLTESIVMGIGRKSVMILDNLGLSAVRVREEFQKTGDMAAAVAKIAREEMGKMGTYTSTAADDLDRLSANLKNLKVAAGRRVAGSFIGELIEDLSTAVDKGLLKDFIFDYEMFVQKISAPQRGKFTPDMLFTKTGEAAERARLALEAAEREYAVWVSGVEEEAAKRKQVAEWQARYNKELAISMGYWNTNPQKNAAPLTLYYRYSQPMDADIISESSYKRSKVRVEKLEEDLKSVAENIEDRYYRMGDFVGDTIARGIARGFSEGKFAIDDFMQYFKQAIIEQIIWMAAKAVINYLVGEAISYGEAYTSAVDTVRGNNTGGGYSNMPDYGGAGIGSDSMPTIGGIGSSIGGGKNVTINFNNPIMSRKFVVDDVIPEINRAAKLGFAN